MPYYGQFLPDLAYGTQRFRPGENPYFADMALSEVAPLVIGDSADSPPDEQLPPPIVPGPRPVPAPMPHIQMPDQFDPGDINVRDRIGQEGTPIPNYPPPEPPRGPSRWRQVAGIAGRALQAGIDAAAVQNIAGGGGTDIMRALSASRGAELNRDMAAAQMARQHAQDEEMRRYREAQIAENQAQAAWYRHRANQETKPQPTKLIFDKFGNALDPYTGQIVRAATAQPPKPTIRQFGNKLVSITESGLPPQTLPDGTVVGGLIAETIANFDEKQPKPIIIKGEHGEVLAVTKTPDGWKVEDTGAKARIPTDRGEPSPKPASKALLDLIEREKERALAAIDRADKINGNFKPGVRLSDHLRRKQQVEDSYAMRRTQAGADTRPYDYGADRAQAQEEAEAKSQAPSAPVQQKPPTPARRPAAPPVGTVDGGYRFKGGDPADPNNWERLR